MSGGVVVVGAGLAGARLAENLRQAGFSDAITLIGREEHIPYDRPPLSKAVLRGDRDLVELKPEQWYADNHVTLTLGVEVTDVDPEARTVSVGDGVTVDYDSLVLATGLDPRMLPGTEDLTGVHVLRTYDDAVALRAAATDGARVVVVGAGFIGCEVAASLSTAGASVTIVEPAETALNAALGPVIGKRVEKLHTDRGVTVRTGVGVDEIFAESGRVTAVALDDGTRIETDIVVLGIGSTPMTGLAESIGLDLADRAHGGGIACDARGATSVDGIYALGDVAIWSDESGVFGHRVEHWNHVVEQAKVLADTLVGGERASTTPVVHYFWTDQFDIKIQCLGTPAADDDVHMVDSDGDKFLAYFSRDGVLTGVVGAGRAGAVMKMRATVAADTPIADLIS